jgi:hypothetical protein
LAFSRLRRNRWHSSEPTNRLRSGQKLLITERP